MSVCRTEITRPRHMDNAIHTIPACNADNPAHGICGKINNRLAHPPGTAVRSKARDVFLNDVERLTRRERRTHNTQGRLFEHACSSFDLSHAGRLTGDPSLKKDWTTQSILFFDGCIAIVLVYA
jgi:hypothetical protein